MEELKLQHIAPYLPYGVKVITPNGIQKLKGIDTEFSAIGLNYWKDGYKKVSFSIDCKPILRPLSDLTKEIEHNGEKLVPIERIMEMYGIVIMVDSQKQLIAPITLEPYNAIRQLFQWHFDVFGLISKGLAIDINTLKQ